MGLTRRTTLAAAGLAVPVLVGATACGAGGGKEVLGADPRYGHASAGDVALSDGWVTEAAATPRRSEDPGTMSSTMATVAGAYFTLTNDSGSADALVSASTPDARAAQLHTTVTGADGSSGTMERVARVVVPAHGSARLRIGGAHVMLLEPTRALRAGDEVPLRLRFASGTVLDTHLPVLDREDRPR